MLSGSSHGLRKQLHSSSADGVIPEDQLQTILEAIEKSLQHIDLDEQGTLLTVGNWQILVARKPDVTESKKLRLKQLDLYAIDYRHVLGEGSQGQVVLAQNILTRQLAAVKIQIPNGPAFDEDLEKERRNLRLCNRLLACAKLQALDADANLACSSTSSSSSSSSRHQDKSAELNLKCTTHYTLMNYYPGRNLLDFLYEYDLTQPKDSPAYFAAKKALDMTSIAKLAMYALTEMIELHEVGLAHRDIKSDNFVVNTTGLLQDCSALKLIDLGTALLMGKEFSKDDASTLGYMPPEYLAIAKDRMDWDAACDCFQLGIVLAELLTTHNYQASLKKFFQEQKQLNDKRHLRFEELQAFMPDVFSQPSKKKNKKSTNMSPEGTEQSIKDHLADHLKTLIGILTPVDRSKRPNLPELKKLLQSLRTELLGAETILQTQFGRERFEAFKLRRKNTTSALPIPTVLSSTKEQVFVPSDPTPRRRSYAELPRRVMQASSSSSSVALAQPLSIPILKLEELTRRGDRISPRSSRKSLAAPGVLAEVFGPEEDIIDQLQHTLTKLKLIGEQASSSSVDAGLQDNFLIYSLLTKNLQGIVEEQDRNEQEKKLSALQKMVTKYHPTQNVPLNEEVESIRLTLARSRLQY